MVTNPKTVQNLINICTRELLSGLNIPLHGYRAKLFGALFRPSMRRFATLLANTDAQVGEEGIGPACASMLRRLSTSCTITGTEYIPKTGPLLITCNHPGGLEILAILSSLSRNDVYMVSNPQPFLMAMPNTSPHMLYLGDEASDRAAVIRSACTHLHQGHVVLIFPSGQMDPDPGFSPGALEFLSEWSSSPGIMLQKAPQTTFLPAAVSGVISPYADRLPYIRKRRPPKARQRAASFLQIVMQVVRRDTWPIHIRLRFGRAIATRDLAPVLEWTALASAMRHHTHELIASLNPLPYNNQPFKG
jgi:hypothetical protein